MLVGLLIAIVVIVIIMVVAKYVIDWMELAPPLRNIVLLVVGLACLILLLNQVGLVGQPFIRLHPG